MSVLRNLESKLAGLVEGTFSRAFKSEVRPVEIARKLAREMDEHKVQSLSRTYAPNEYAVWLSPRRPRAVRGLRGRAARASCRATCSSTPAASGSRCSRAPEIEFKTDERLRLGEFGIQARLVRPPRPDARGAEPGRRGPHDGLLGLRAARRAAARARPAARHARGCASTGAPSVLGSGGAVLGRSRDCDVVLDDPNVSRHHAEVRPVRRLVDRARPRLHQRRQGQRPPHPRPAVAQARRRDRARHLARRPSSWSRPMALDPVAVALKFGFLAVLYLFLLWMARSALKDLRRGADGGYAGRARTTRTPPACTSPRRARRGGDRRRAAAARGDRARACAPAPPTISRDGALLGRGDQADIQLEDGSPRRSTRGSSRRGM